MIQEDGGGKGKICHPSPHSREGERDFDEQPQI